MKVLPRVILKRQYLQTVTKGVILFPYDNRIITIRSLEEPWLDNSRMISCIPEGVYRCEWGHMNRFKADHYQIMDVPNRDRVFIHSGNSLADTEGCVLLGLDDPTDATLGMSRAAVSYLENGLNRKPFILDIQGDGRTRLTK